EEEVVQPALRAARAWLAGGRQRVDELLLLNLVRISPQHRLAPELVERIRIPRPRVGGDAVLALDERGGDRRHGPSVTCKRQCSHEQVCHLATVRPSSATLRGLVEQRYGS